MPTNLPATPHATPVAGQPARLAFFSPDWFDMAAAELRAVLQAQPDAAPWSLSLIERFGGAPPSLGLSAPYDVPGLRLDIAGGVVRLRRGVQAGENAALEIDTHWDDAQRAALMTVGEDYARFTAWRIGAGRLARRGDLPPSAAAVLAAVHDKVAGRTRPA